MIVDLHRRQLQFNRLALKIAGGVAAAMTLLVLGLAWWQPISGVGAGVLILGSGVAAYGVVHRVLARRLELARSTLKQIRKHRFENLGAAHLPDGDELNALIWQVYRTGQALEKEIQELKKIENYRREYLGNVSHELKTPIFTIHGFAETLLDGALEDERVNRGFVEKILRNADRLHNLANDLSEISRLETGHVRMTPAPFNLARLTDEVIESLELVANAKQISLTRRAPDALPLVMGERERIRQVLVNLVDNAVKYNNPGGVVEVVLRVIPSAEEIKVSVVDNGIGVAAQDIPRLTERFYRVDKSRSRDQGGTGLGLAIVKHILNAHGSRLMIESHVGRGSTFGFTLPTEPPPATRRPQ